MLNKVILMGRLTRDPELRHTQTGTAVASFTLAVDRDFVDKASGERNTDFIDIVAWRNTAEFVSKHFVKGQLTAVSGRLQIRDWKDRDGNNRRSAEVVAENVYFAEGKRNNDSSYGGNSYGGGSYGGSSYGSGYGNSYGGDSGFSASSSMGGFAELDDGDEELPF